MANNDYDRLVAKLITDSSRTKRIKDLMDGGESLVFDFNDPAHKVTGKDGFIVAANSDNYPAEFMAETGLTIAYVYMGACGFNPPHMHHGGSEFLYVIYGKNLQTQVVAANGNAAINYTLSTGQMIVYPQGSVHYQHNTDCSPVTFLAAIESREAETLSMDSALSQFDDEINQAAFGTTLPPGVDSKAIIFGAKSCLDRCGISKDNFDFQKFTYESYANFTGSESKLYPPASPSSTSSASYSDYTYSASSTPSSYHTLAKGALKAPEAVTPISQQDDPSFSKNPLHLTVVGLGVLSVVLLMGLCFVTIVMIRGRRSRSYSRANNIPTFHVGTGVRSYSTPYDDDGSMEGSRYNAEKPTPLLPAGAHV